MGENADLLKPKGLGQIKRITPADFQHAVDAGTARIGDPRTGLDNGVKPLTPKEAFAYELFGNDTYGRPAIRDLEQKCRAYGIDVTFDTANIMGIPYSIPELRDISREKNDGRERCMVLRPKWMIVDGKSMPITYASLAKLFGSINPFGGSKLFNDLLSDSRDQYLNEGIDGRYAFPTKGLVPDSLMKNYAEQDLLRIAGETRRSTIEAIWDMMLFGEAVPTGDLPRVYDMTSSRRFKNEVVAVGSPINGSFSLATLSEDRSSPNFGMVTQR